MFEVIPAIDIKNGKCVQLRQGVPGSEMIALDDPFEVAVDWISQGAQTLHLIDLDGAIDGIRRNAEMIERIVHEAEDKDVYVQIGGGIRSFKNAEALLDIGADRVILSTAAIRRPEIVQEISDAFGESCVVVALDSKGGKVAIDGWTTISEHNAVDVAQMFEELGAGTLLFTNIDTEGLLNGIDTTVTETLIECVSIPVIASGGVTTVDDILRFKKIGASGVVVGSALYTKKFTYKEAIDTVSSRSLTDLYEMYDTD